MKKYLLIYALLGFGFVCNAGIITSTKVSVQPAKIDTHLLLKHSDNNGYNLKKLTVTVTNEGMSREGIRRLKPYLREAGEYESPV